MQGSAKPQGLKNPPAELTSQLSQKNAQKTHTSEWHLYQFNDRYNIPNNELNCIIQPFRPSRTSDVGTENLENPEGNP